MMKLFAWCISSFACGFALAYWVWLERFTKAVLEAKYPANESQTKTMHSKTEQKCWEAFQSSRGPAAGQLFVVVYYEDQHSLAKATLDRMIAKVEEESCCGKG